MRVGFIWALVHGPTGRRVLYTNLQVSPLNFCVHYSNGNCRLNYFCNSPAVSDAQGLHFPLLGTIRIVTAQNVLYAYQIVNFIQMRYGWQLFDVRTGTVELTMY